MKRYVYSKKTLNLIRVEEVEPSCADFCDSCGDCLRCYQDDPCVFSEDKNHLWVIYRDED